MFQYIRYLKCIDLIPSAIAAASIMYNEIKLYLNLKRRPI